MSSCKIDATVILKLLISRRASLFADRNCFRAPAKRCSGILRTVESRDDNFKIYCLFAVYQPNHFPVVVLFAFLSRF